MTWFLVPYVHFASPGATVSCWSFWHSDGERKKVRFDIIYGWVCKHASGKKVHSKSSYLCKMSMSSSETRPYLSGCWLRGGAQKLRVGKDILALCHIQAIINENHCFDIIEMEFYERKNPSFEGSTCERSKNKMSCRSRSRMRQRYETPRQLILKLHSTTTSNPKSRKCCVVSLYHGWDWRAPGMYTINQVSRPTEFWCRLKGAEARIGY